MRPKPIDVVGVGPNLINILVTAATFVVSNAVPKSIFYRRGNPCRLANRQNLLFGPAFFSGNPCRLDQPRPRHNTVGVGLNPDDVRAAVAFRSFGPFAGDQAGVFERAQDVPNSPLLKSGRLAEVRLPHPARPRATPREDREKHSSL